MYGFMSILASSWRFIGKDVRRASVPRSDCCRLKGDRMPKKVDKEDFATRWKTIRDLCSVIACHNAFEDCTDGDGVGLGRCQFVTCLLSLSFC